MIVSRPSIRLALSLALASVATLAGQGPSPGTEAPSVPLIGIARLKADTFAAGPPAGAFLPDGRRATVSFPAQPVQGFSSIAPVPGDSAGWWYALSDNGFGSKMNSPDCLLRIYRVRPRWKAAHDGDGGVEVDAHFIALADPDRRVPFRLVHESTAERLLTGADFDPESMVALPDGTFWIGDEFGPFLLHAGADGRLIEPPFELPDVRSPDHPLLAPADAGKASEATTPRSRGFEGLALSADGHVLYVARESTALDAGTTSLHEFALDQRRFTGRQWTYPFDAPGHTLTELVAWGADFLAIERDNGHGPEARFKRVFRIGLGEPGSAVEKRLVVDLLHLDDPAGLAGPAGPFAFPFITPEAIWPLPDGTLVLVNDNNFPATGGRAAGVRDDNEFIRLSLRP